MSRASRRGEVDLDSWVGDLPDRLLHCRELGHNWKPLTVSMNDGAYDRRLRCPSCRTVRIQLLTASGHVISNRYDYPDGYLAKGAGVQQANRDAFRVEAITRFLAPKADLRVAS